MTRYSERLRLSQENEFLEEEEKKRKRMWLPTMPPDGCFAEGTPILLANGEIKNVETLTIYDSKTQEGDRVMTLGGTSATVVDLIHGPEKLPMVNLTVQAYDGDDYREITVSVTEQHPVLVRYNYLVQANLIEINEKVHTLWGPGIVKKVERATTEKDVWNFVLGSEQFLQESIYGETALRHAFSANSLLGLPAKNHIVFSNGVALATWTLQTQLVALLKNGININQFS
ncbi:Hint domain-containing protein [Neobacillus sp. 3P2-tot-E-2]|uniref:Hint domain-containing protein n=1 Tax=Neobacillus sp. 3P2-tot-E-2 TaxID=3132212 RepID=UPI0039A24187